MGWRNLTVAGLLLGSPAAAAAQEPVRVVVRADAAASLGWFNSKEAVAPADSDWYNRSAIGSGIAGWYWTDNVKTEIEAGLTSRATLSTYWTEFRGNQAVFFTGRTEHETKRVAASQQYQFFRNAWFHPFLGAGIDLSWKTTQLAELTSYPSDTPGGPPRRPDDPATFEETTDLEVRPYALIGYKAYLGPHVFFRNDLRMTFGGGVEEVMIRFGLGIDFNQKRRQ